MFGHKCVLMQFQAGLKLRPHAMNTQLLRRRFLSSSFGVSFLSGDLNIVTANGNPSISHVIHGAWYQVVDTVDGLQNNNSNCNRSLHAVMKS